MRTAGQAAREAERRFPVRIRIGIPLEGLGSRLDQITAWLGSNCGADGWTMTPSGTGGVVNDAVASTLPMPPWQAPSWRVAVPGKGSLRLVRIREDEPTPRLGAAHSPQDAMKRIRRTSPWIVPSNPRN
jgi:hypothetical protein